MDLVNFSSKITVKNFSKKWIMTEQVSNADLFHNKINFSPDFIFNEYSNLCSTFSTPNPCHFEVIFLPYISSIAWFPIIYTLKFRKLGLRRKEKTKVQEKQVDYSNSWLSTCPISLFKRINGLVESLNFPCLNPWKYP